MSSLPTTEALKAKALACSRRTRGTREGGSSIRWLNLTVLILALDTTTRGGSIAVADDDRVLALLPGDAARTHGERLPAEIAAALDRAGVAQSAIDLLAVATGPGAFTGLRIGLAAIQGLAMTLDRPVVGVSALDALADRSRAAVRAVHRAVDGRATRRGVRHTA